MATLLSFTPPVKVLPGARILHKILDWRKKTLEEHLPRDPYTYYVTDLIRCSMKREFEISHPELLYGRITNGRTLLGDMVHRGLESLLKEIYGESVKVETEATDQEKIIEINNQKYRVKGRIDAILDGSIGIEIKETVSTGNLPFPHHIEQALLYNWLYGFKETILFYLSPEGIYEFVVSGSISEDEVRKRISSPKAPRYEWECKYCEFRDICPIVKLQKENRANSV